MKSKRFQLNKSDFIVTAHKERSNYIIYEGNIDFKKINIYRRPIEIFCDNDKVETYRGIKLGDDLARVIKAYGDSQLTKFVEDEDVIKKFAIEYEGPVLWGSDACWELSDLVETDIYCDYLYNKENGIRFYFNKQKKVKTIVYYSFCKIPQYNLTKGNVFRNTFPKYIAGEPIEVVNNRINKNVKSQFDLEKYNVDLQSAFEIINKNNFKHSVSDECTIFNENRIIDYIRKNVRVESSKIHIKGISEKAINRIIKQLIRKEIIQKIEKNKKVYYIIKKVNSKEFDGNTIKKLSFKYKKFYIEISSVKGKKRLEFTQLAKTPSFFDRNKPKIVKDFSINLSNAKLKELSKGIIDRIDGMEYYYQNDMSSARDMNSWNLNICFDNNEKFESYGYACFPKKANNLMSYIVKFIKK